jgi:hypothetical protein
MDMDQEFSRALDGLHHQIDVAVDAAVDAPMTLTRAPESESWNPVPVKKPQDPTVSWLARAFLILVVLGGL